MSSGRMIMVTARSQNGAEVTITLPNGDIGKFWIEMSGPLTPGQVLVGAPYDLAVDRAKQIAAQLCAAVVV